MDTLSLEPMRHCPRRARESAGGHLRLPRQVWKKSAQLPDLFRHRPLLSTCSSIPSCLRQFIPSLWLFQPSHPSFSHVREKGAGAEVDGGDTCAPGRSE